MSIKLNGSSAGSVSFDAPSDTSPSGTDVTLTLPTSAGSANQFLKNSGTAGSLEFAALGYTDVPTGSVIQIVQSTNETSTSEASGSFIKSNQTVTITPHRSDSHLLVITNLICQNSASTSGGIEVRLRYEDTSADLAPSTAGMISEYGYANHVGGTTIQYLDTAGSWSGAVQYRIYFRRYADGTAFVSWGSMTVMEIAQ